MYESEENELKNYDSKIYTECPLIPPCKTVVYDFVDSAITKGRGDSSYVEIRLSSPYVQKAMDFLGM